MQPHNSQSSGENSTPSSGSCPISLLLGRKSPPRGGRSWTSGLACKGVFCSTDDDTFFNKNNAIPPSWTLNLTDKERQRPTLGVERCPSHKDRWSFEGRRNVEGKQNNPWGPSIRVPRCNLHSSQRSRPLKLGGRLRQ